VAELAIGAGAEMLNDISGLKYDPKIAEVAAQHGVPLILMQCAERRGRCRSSRGEGRNENVTAGLRESVAVARRAGVRNRKSFLIGNRFRESYAQNFELLAKLPELARLGYPVLSELAEGFIGATLARNGKPLPAEQRFGERRRRWRPASCRARILCGCTM